MSKQNYRRTSGKPMMFTTMAYGSVRYVARMRRYKQPPITPEELERCLREYEEKRQRDSLQRDSIRQDAGQPSEDRTRSGKKKHKNKTT